MSGINALRVRIKMQANPEGSLRTVTMRLVPNPAAEVATLVPRSSPGAASAASGSATEVADRDPVLATSGDMVLSTENNNVL